VPSRPKSGGARDQARVEAGRAAERTSARAPSPGRGNSGKFKRPLGETPLPKKTRGLQKAGRLPKTAEASPNPPWKGARRFFGFFGHPPCTVTRIAMRRHRAIQ
jgi:hypothetical protein